MINWLKKIFQSKPQLKEGHEKEFVFESGGISYYKFVNEQKIPYERAMSAMDIYTELQEKTDAKYHKTAYESIIELLKQGNNIVAGNIAYNSLERMNNITNVDIMYKLASVLYFDATENISSYDYEYNEKKIKLWQKDNDIEGFFLKTPLIDYLPSFDGLGMNINQYTTAQRKRLIQTLKSHLSLLSGKSKKIELISTLESQIKELEELVMNN